MFSISKKDHPRPSPGKGREALFLPTTFSVYHDFLGTNLIEGVTRNNKSNVISVIIKYAKKFFRRIVRITIGS